MNETSLRSRLKPLKLSVLFCIALFSWVIVLTHANQYGPIGNDFVQDYAAAIAARQGQAIHGNHIGVIAAATGHGWGEADFQNFHPPFLVMLAWPFSYLPYDTAFLAWNVVLVLFYVASLFILGRELNISAERTLALFAVLPLWGPVFATMCLGQINALLLLLLCLSWILWRRSRPLTRACAGIPLGLACLIKLFPGYFVFLLILRRDFAILGIFTLTVLAGFAICSVVFGYDQLLAYFSSTIALDVQDWGAYPINHSIFGIFTRAFSTTTYALPIVNAPLVGTIVIRALSFMVVCSMSYAVWYSCSNRDPAKKDLLFWSQLIPMFLISPITWQHSMTLMLPLYLVVIGTMKESRPLRLACWFSLLTLSLIDIQSARYFINLFPQGVPWIVNLIGVNIPFFGLCALLICTINLILSRDQIIHE